MNRKYNLKLDLQFRCNNSIMKFNQFDNNTSDFFIRITNSGNLVDIEKAIVVLVVIKPSGKVSSQFIEVKNGLVYVDLKPNMRDEIGTYTAKAMLILEDERVVTDVISYKVEEDKIFSLLNDSVEDTEEFTLLTDMLNRLSTIEISEEQRMINEAERILSEENRKIEEAKRVEAELIRQHEEADRAKYDATRESNENIRKQNESIRLANETNRIDEEAKRVEEENKRKLAEEERKANYNFMTEDEERRRTEANAHKEAEVLRVQAETNRVNEEAKRRTTEQARILAENARVDNENTRKANETTRQNNETKRVEAETQRQNRYNSFIADAEANASNFENYTNSAKVKEEERKSNELDRKSQEAKRVSNEVERISNENTRKANEVVREKNEASRQNTFTNKVNEVDKKIIELNTTKDNFVSNINTKVDNKISEIDNVKDNFVSSISTKVDNKISELDSAKSDMTNTVSNKVNEVENRFNALTSKQQQNAEVIDARDGEISLKARLDRDIEKAKQVYVNVEGSHISTDSSVGYLKDVEILGNTIQSASNLADIRSVGDKVEGQELYEIPVLSVGKNIMNMGEGSVTSYGITATFNKDTVTLNGTATASRWIGFKIPNSIKVPQGSYCLTTNSNYTNFNNGSIFLQSQENTKFDAGNKLNLLTDMQYISLNINIMSGSEGKLLTFNNVVIKFQLEEGTQATPYEPYQEDKLTILSPVQLEKVGDVRDRIVCKAGVWGVEKSIKTKVYNGSEEWSSFANDTNSQFVISKGDMQTGDLVICNQLTSTSTNEFEDYTCYIGSSNFNVLLPSNISLDDFVNSLKSNNLILKYKNNQPMFIPLPHDQQVKLRTFAGQTNIAFLTEIEGTIKAQVPKSLGATVNTHTEQINNLNKELDRVKKLEESTVSTVTTESDFTTVEATSNGYFEDVKLEGKTLVNLATQPTNNGSINHQYATISTVTNIKPSTEYTYIIRNNGSETLKLYLNHNGGFDWFDLDVEANSTVIGKAKTLPTIDGDIWLSLKKAETVEQNLQVVLLEGDHTQNPPSYFEGLKSVGQSATTSEDGADEIVVSSVNENLFDVESYASHINSLNDGVSKVELDGTTLKSILIGTVGKNFFSFNRRGSFICTCEFVDATKWRVQSRTYDSGWTTSQSIKLPFGTYDELKVFSSENTSIKNIQIKVSETNSLYVPHKSDKKRLLYYNDETQTWEKPILREWDSIEKHSDGKYYYHQRSAEVVLNGSESWIKDGVELENTIQFALMNLPRIPGTALVCDKFVYADVTSVDFEGIKSYANSSIGIRIFKTKLSTQDVNGFKQWLQANNLTVVYQLAQEKVYECTNIDLITYANETNYIVECGAISPKTTLKVHNNISNVVSLLQKKVSLLESDVTSYMITQNRLMLASRYNADNVTFKVDYPSMMSEREVEIDYDLFKLIQDNIIVGPENYDVDKMLEIMDLYAMIGFITWEMWDYLYEVIDSQINPVIGDLEGAPEI